VAPYCFQAEVQTLNRIHRYLMRPWCPPSLYSVLATLNFVLPCLVSAGRHSLFWKDFSNHTITLISCLYTGMSSVSSCTLCLPQYLFIGFPCLCPPLDWEQLDR
jgi:hypothetical protein